MRYDLTDFEWSVIEPILPMDRRGPKPRDNRRVLNGIFWVLRTGAPWRDLPERYGPYTSAYNRFNRWRKAGIWDRLMDAVVKAYDGKVQMIDSSIICTLPSYALTMAFIRRSQIPALRQRLKRLYALV